MKNRIPPLFWIISFLVVSNVQAGNIYGKIIDNNGKPASEIVVQIGDKTDFTDSNGRYFLRDIPDGNQTIVLIKGGKEVKKLSVNMGNHDRTLDMELGGMDIEIGN